MPRFSKPPDRLCPSEGLFHHLASPLTDPISLVPRRSAVNEAPSLLRDALRNVGSHPEFANRLNELPLVIGLVASHRPRACYPASLQQPRSRFRFGLP